MMLNVRKLAALDLHSFGPRFILAEFGLGVLGLAALGLLMLRSGLQHGYSITPIFLGAYMLALNVNYVPLLIYAIGLARSDGATTEIADELGDLKAAFRKYRRQSLFILLPFAVLIASVRQELQRRRA